MAWPASRRTTYVAHSTPYISADDLVAMQDGTVGIVNGIYNLTGITLTNGTPGSVVTPVAGSLVASRSIFSAATPTASTSAAGEHFRETPPAACGYFSGSSGGVGVNAAYGLQAKSRGSIGNYNLTLQRIPTGPSANNVVVLVTGIGDTIATAQVSLDGSNRPIVNVKVYVLTPGSPANIVASDSNFHLAAWVF